MLSETCLDLLEPRLTFLPGRGSAAAPGALADVGAGVCVVVEHLVTLLLAVWWRLVLDVELMVMMRVGVIMPSAAVIVAVAVDVVNHDAVNALLPVLTIRERAHYNSIFKTKKKEKSIKSDFWDSFQALNTKLVIPPTECANNKQTVVSACIYIYLANGVGRMYSCCACVQLVGHHDGQKMTGTEQLHRNDLLWRTKEIAQIAPFFSYTLQPINKDPAGFASFFPVSPVPSPCLSAEKKKCNFPPL